MGDQFGLHESSTKSESNQTELCPDTQPARSNLFLPVAAAASVPSSFTSIKALCTTSDTFNASGEFSRSPKSAASLNIVFIPIYKKCGGEHMTQQYGTI